MMAALSSPPELEGWKGPPYRSPSFPSTNPTDTPSRSVPPPPPPRRLVSRSFRDLALAEVHRSDRPVDPSKYYLPMGFQDSLAALQRLPFQLKCKLKVRMLDWLKGQQQLIQEALGIWSHTLNDLSPVETDYLNARLVTVGDLVQAHTVLGWSAHAVKAVREYSRLSEPRWEDILYYEREFKSWMELCLPDPEMAEDVRRCHEEMLKARMEGCGGATLYGEMKAVKQGILNCIQGAVALVARNKAELEERCHRVCGRVMWLPTVFEFYDYAHLDTLPAVLLGVLYDKDYAWLYSHTICIDGFLFTNPSIHTVARAYLLARKQFALDLMRKCGEQNSILSMQSVMDGARTIAHVDNLEAIRMLREEYDRVVQRSHDVLMRGEGPISIMENSVFDELRAQMKEVYVSEVGILMSAGASSSADTTTASSAPAASSSSSSSPAASSPAAAKTNPNTVAGQYAGILLNRPQSYSSMFYFDSFTTSANGGTNGSEAGTGRQQQSSSSSSLAFRNHLPLLPFEMATEAESSSLMQMVSEGGTVDPQSQPFQPDSPSSSGPPSPSPLSREGEGGEGNTEENAPEEEMFVYGEEEVSMGTTGDDGPKLSRAEAYNRRKVMNMLAYKQRLRMAKKKEEEERRRKEEEEAAAEGGGGGGGGEGAGKSEKKKNKNKQNKSHTKK